MKMEKILSIIIPTYNMEDLLPRCLDSLIIKEKFDNLDIIIVNDGSEDKSSDIGHQYEMNFPNVIRVIDKPNGNYGSCINCGLKKAKGKYVKVLDSDDYFNKLEFSKFVELLLSLDADAVLTDYTVVQSDKRKLIRTMSDKTIGKIVQIDDMPIRFVQMHGITYKTKLLRDMDYKQTEGISYTDQEWIFFPFFFLKDIIYYPLNIYQYVLGREGQTMNADIVLKCYSHTLKSVLRMMDYYAHFDRLTLSENRIKYLSSRIIGRCFVLYKIFLIKQSNEDYDDVSCRLLDESLKKCDLYLYEKVGHMPIHRFLPYYFIERWRVNNKRVTNFLLRKL